MVTIRALGIVAVLVLAGCSPVPPSLIPHSTPTIAPQSTPAPPTAFPSPSAIPTPPPTAPPSSAGLTSASIHPESVTFISPDVGWVLGLSLCDAKPCLRLAKTVNAGLSWNWIPGGDVPALSTSSQWELRFADGDNGWISGPELYSTHDAGRTWTRIEFPGFDSPGSTVGALEAGDGHVYAEIPEATDPNTYGPVVLFESPVTEDSWHAVSGVATGSAGFAGNISLAQGVFWVSLHPAVVTAEGSQSLSTLYRSSNGVTWHREPQPCPSGSAASVAAATSLIDYVVCGGGLAAGSQAKSLYVSSNGGATYRLMTDPPLSGDFETVAASPGTVAVAASSGATYVFSSFNGGVTWTTTASFGDGGLGLSDLGFTTAMQGVVIHGQPQYPESLQLLMTRDGGHTWSAVPVYPG